MAILTQSNTPRYEGRRVTREEYLDLPEDGFQYDMIDGVLHMSPSAFFEHNDALSQVLRCMTNYLVAYKTGRAVVETDVYFPDGGDVLRPDISVVLKENYKIIIGHIHGAPDIVAEVLSDATCKRDLGVKADRYLANGVREYWIADPNQKIIALWINENKKSWRKIEANNIESSVLKGLVIRQADIFPEEY